MRESYKTFVNMLIGFANPWICFDLNCQFSKDSICGFVLSCGVQKICFVDLFCDAIFKRLNESNKIITNPQYYRLVESVKILWIRICKSSGVQKIYFVNSFHPTCSKDLICRFYLSYSAQKIRFVDSFWSNKNSKLLDYFHFGTNHEGLPYPYSKFERMIT